MPAQLTQHAEGDIPPEQSLDRRRRPSRELTETLVNRACLLPVLDRALIVAVFRDGMSIADVARIGGTKPRTLRRRLRILSERLLSEQFVWMSLNRDKLPPTLRRVATACILHGRPIRDAARHLRTSSYAVRRHLDSINALYEFQRHDNNDQLPPSDLSNDLRIAETDAPILRSRGIARRDIR